MGFSLTCAEQRWDAEKMYRAQFLGVYRAIYWAIYWVYIGDNGKENGNYYNGVI